MLTHTPTEGYVALDDVVRLAGRFGELVPTDSPQTGVGACLFMLYTIFAGTFPEPEKFNTWAEQVSTYLAASILERNPTPTVVLAGDGHLN